MPDLRSDDPAAARSGEVDTPGSGPGEADDAEGNPVGPSTAAEREALERRAFVRRMGTDAVRTAGSVFSLSRILTRTAAGVGQSVVGELERMHVASAGGDPIAATSGEAPSGGDVGDVARAAADALDAGSPSMPDSTAVSPATVELPSSAPAPVAPAPPELKIGGAERAILEAAASAVIAVNRAGYPPQLTTASVLWDGSTLRFLTLGWSRRASMLRADPQIGVLIDGPGDGSFVTVTGRARIADGRTVRDEAWPILLREAGDEAAAALRWDGLIAEDADRAVVVIEPDQVLAGRR